MLTFFKNKFIISFWYSFIYFPIRQKYSDDKMLQSLVHHKEKRWQSSLKNHVIHCTVYVKVYVYIKKLYYYLYMQTLYSEAGIATFKQSRATWERQVKFK
jgi:hypothetical protein